MKSVEPNARTAPNIAKQKQVRVRAPASSQSSACAEPETRFASSQVDPMIPVAATCQRVAGWNRYGRAHGERSEHGETVESERQDEHPSRVEPESILKKGARLLGAGAAGSEDQRHWRAHPGDHAASIGDAFFIIGPEPRQRGPSIAS